ncbi:MAG TPA: ribosomal protein L7/L12 [Anaerolineaceae bacterium]
MPVESLKCPNCGAPLDAAQDLVKCAYCHCLVRLRLDADGHLATDLVPEGARESPITPEMTTSQAQAAIDRITAEAAQHFVDQITNLVAAGNLLEAIQRYREKTGDGLVESKIAVEALRIEAGRQAMFERLMQGKRPGIQGEVLTDSGMVEEIKRLLRAGNKIEAIKIYRQHTEAGLKEAKEAVDRLEVSLKMQSLPETADNGAEFTPLQRELRALLAAGRKPEAVELYRKRTQASIAESRLVVDQMAATLPPADRARLKANSRKEVVTCIVLILAALIFLGGLAALILLTS